MGVNIGDIFLSGVCIYFGSEMFRFRVGWVGLWKSEHCSDFKNTYIFYTLVSPSVVLTRINMQCHLPYSRGHFLFR